MKTKIIAACTAAAFVITITSCGLFGSKKPPTAFSLEGEWIIDSVENKGSDSSKNMASFLLALAKKDNLPLAIRFDADSSYQLVNSTDAAKGKYYLSADQNSLFVAEDSAYTQLNILSNSDSAFQAATTDSVVYYLRKK